MVIFQSGPTVKIAFDIWLCGELRSRRGKIGFLHQHDDGFAYVRKRERPHGDLLGVSGATSLPPRVTKRSKCHDRRILMV